MLNPIISSFFCSYNISIIIYNIFSPQATGLCSSGSGCRGRAIATTGLTVPVTARRRGEQEAAQLSTARALRRRPSLMVTHKQTKWNRNNGCLKPVLVRPFILFSDKIFVIFKSNTVTGFISHGRSWKKTPASAQWRPNMFICTSVSRIQ